MKKYELTNETIEHNGRSLYRIKALRNFGIVKKGDLGGYIEKEENLSHERDCWVFDNAKVYGNARVFDNAKIYDNATVSDNAKVYGNTRVNSETVATRDVVSVTGFVYPITLTDNHVSIGCKQFTFGQALKISRRWSVEKNNIEDAYLEEAERIKGFLVPLIKRRIKEMKK